MNIRGYTALSLVLAIALGTATIGCEKGPAERAGENVDRAVDDLKDAAKDATN